MKNAEYFGEMAALLNVDRSASAQATEYTECYTYTKHQIDKLVRSSPMAVQKLLKVQLQRITQTNERASNVVSQAHPLILAAEIVDLHTQANGVTQNAVVKVPYEPVVTSLPHDGFI